nr:MAG TPA: hypothetical protein [Caudoviricetes sp.]
MTERAGLDPDPLGELREAEVLSRHRRPSLP